MFTKCVGCEREQIKLLIVSHKQTTGAFNSAVRIKRKFHFKAFFSDDMYQLQTNIDSIQRFFVFKKCTKAKLFCIDTQRSPFSPTQCSGWMSTIILWGRAVSLPADISHYVWTETCFFPSTNPIAQSTPNTQNQSSQMCLNNRTRFCYRLKFNKTTYRKRTEQKMKERGERASGFGSSNQTHKLFWRQKKRE